MAGAPQKSTFDRRLSKLERAVSEMQRVSRLQRASISSGQLIIKNDGTLETRYQSGRTSAVIGDLGKYVEHLTSGVLILKDTTDIDRVLFSIYEVNPGNDDYAIQGGNLDRCDFILDGPGASHNFSMIIPNEAGIVGVDDFLFLFGTVAYDNPPTTGAGANVHWDAGTHFLERVTSSLRYKQDIEDVDIDPEAVLGLVGRTWRDKGQVEKDPETTARYIGFIAEEVDALGLTEFLVYDEEDRPDALQYDRICVGLVEVAKHQRDRIDELETTVASMEARLAALEATITGGGE